MYKEEVRMIKTICKYAVIGLLGLACLVGGCCTVKTVPVGTVSVATLFGKVKGTYSEGLNFPVNPLYRWTTFDVREQTIKETVSIPSSDQQITDVDISVNYRIKATNVGNILQSTGAAEQAVAVHLIPNFRSISREQGKSIKKVEDFFLEITQRTLQVNILSELQARLDSKGIEVTAVLIRDMKLPAYIVQAIEAKKVREQEAEKQVAELARYKTEQEQIAVKAKAEALAAEADAQKKRTLADAQAYEIERVNKAIAGSPAYIQLKALEALQTISKDPAAKMYFLNGDSPSPLPLMHLGDTTTIKGVTPTKVEATK